MDKKCKIILVEDSRVLREGMVAYLNDAGFNVKGVGSCMEFYQALAASSFSLAVVDIGLPDQSGYVVVEYIRKNTKMGVIILSAHDAIENRLRGYDTGADLYLVKPIDLRELSSVIKNLAIRIEERASVPLLSPQPGAWQLARSSWHLVTPAGCVIQLTAKEMQFMMLLAETPGMPVSRDKILVTLGYRDDYFANRTLDSLVQRLRRKIEVNWNKQSPVKTIHSVGYCFSAPVTIS